MSAPDTALAVSAAVGAAAAFGLGSALQHDQAGRVPRQGWTALGLVPTLLRRPLWLLGGTADLAGVGLQLLALRYGAVALVQPLLVATLRVGVLLSALFWRRWPGRREWVGVLLVSAGLALLAPGTAASGLGRPPTVRGVVVAAVVLAALVAVLLAAARAWSRVRPVASGLAAGVVTGTGAVLLSLCAAQLDRPLALLRTPTPYAAVLVGAFGLQLIQSSFQTGTLGPPLAALSLTEPIAAVTLAAQVLHQDLPTDPAGRALAVIGALVAVAGVAALTSGPTHRRLSAKGGTLQA